MSGGRPYRFGAGALSSWLWHELKALGFPVICLMRATRRGAVDADNKTNRNDARGLRLVRMGWYREAK